MSVTEYSFKLSFSDGSIALVACKFDSSSDIPKEKLSNEEKEKLLSFESAKRQLEFGYSRCGAKKALSMLVPDLNVSDVSIKNDQAGCPYFFSLNDNIKNYRIALTHSSGVAFALVSDFACGIDVEFFREDRVRAFQRMSPRFSDKKQLLAAWTLKESLAKALGTGVVKNFEEYEVDNFEIANNVARCTFVNYSDYLGISHVTSRRSIAVVSRKKFCGFFDHFASFVEKL